MRVEVLFILIISFLYEIALAMNKAVLKMSHHSTVIVGAGISGISLGRIVKDVKPTENLIILEKSAGYGGRMATRTLKTNLDIKFDHGAQYYSVKAATQPLHEFWTSTSTSKLWYSTDKGDRFTSVNGMSTLAKTLANELNVELNYKVTKIESDNDNWKIYGENKEPMICKNLILSCPLPQSLDLLTASGITYNSDLNGIKYAKALVALCTINPQTAEKALSSTHNNIFQKLFQSYGSYTFTPAIHGIHNIVDQYKKGISKYPAYSIIMHPDFSELHYESSDDIIKAEILKKLNLTDEHVPIDERFDTHLEIHEIKRWKYSHPENNYKQPYIEIASNLYVIGDGLGGGSINGAVTSATEFSKIFLSKI